VEDVMEVTKVYELNEDGNFVYSEEQLAYLARVAQAAGSPRAKQLAARLLRGEVLKEDEDFWVAINELDEMVDDIVDVLEEDFTPEIEERAGRLLQLIEKLKEEREAAEEARLEAALAARELTGGPDYFTDEEFAALAPDMALEGRALRDSDQERA
jgi:hypothetical protein